MVTSAGPGLQAPAPRSLDGRGPERKDTIMTINQPTGTAAAAPDAATGRTGRARRRIIILASVVLVLLAGVAAAVTALIPSSAPAAHGTVRPLDGTGTGTGTLNLLTGAASADFSGYLSPLGAETGYDQDTFTVTGASTFSYTGTRTFVAANGDKLFSAISGKGTFTRTAAKTTETDTITGGTGRFAGASGTYTDTISFIVVSVSGSTQTSHFTAVAHGQIRY